MILMGYKIKDGNYDILQSGEFLTDLSKPKIIYNSVSTNDLESLNTYGIEIKIRKITTVEPNTIIRSTSTNFDTKCPTITLEFINTQEFSFTQNPVELFDINGEKIYIRASLRILNNSVGIINYAILAR